MTELLERYRKLHSGEGTYLFDGAQKEPDETLWSGNCFKRVFALFRFMVKKRGTSFSVLDYGCGKAEYLPYVYQELPGKIRQWYLYDPGHPAYDKLPNERFDYVTCTEVMEHILDYDKALAEIEQRLLPDGIAIFTISGFPDRREFEPGLNMHVTLKSFDEWKEILKAHFGNKKVILLYNRTWYWESWNATI